MTGNIQRRKQRLSTASHVPHFYIVRISNPACKGLFNSPGVATWKGHFYICNLCILFPAMDLWSRRQKSPMLVFIWFLQYHIGSGWERGWSQAVGAGGEGGQGSGSVSQGLVYADVQGVSWSRDRFSPVPEQCPLQPVVDWDNLDSMNNEQHIIFLRIRRSTERSLPKFISLPRLPGVPLCLRGELTSFFPSVRKRWSKVFKQQ